MAKGALPADHPLMVTTVGLVAEDIERAGFAKADVVVAVGYDPVEYAPARWNPSGHARLVHVDFTAAEVDARYQPDVEVVADVREALELLAPLVGVRPHAKPPAPRAPDPRRRSDAFPVLPQRAMADLEAALAPEDLVISDVGAHKLWVAKAYGARLPNTVIVSNGFAAMGIGLPGAIAAKLAEPDRRVVTVTGDGGFLMNVQELETARRLGLAFVVLVLRDDGYGVIRWKQQKRFGRTAGVDLGQPRPGGARRGVRVPGDPRRVGGGPPAGPRGRAGLGRAGARRLPDRLRGERPAGGAVARCAWFTRPSPRAL